MPLLNKMRIYTNSKRVRRARENILEFLLLNHPLDCPIRDQGVSVIYKIYHLLMVRIRVDFMKNSSVCR